MWRGDLTEGLLRYEFGGLIFGGAYTRRGLFSEFYGMFHKMYSLYGSKECLLIVEYKLTSHPVLFFKF